MFPALTGGPPATYRNAVRCVAERAPELQKRTLPPVCPPVVCCFCLDGDLMSIRSGIDLLDERLGGLQPRRTYVLTGGPGTGKTIACLEFLFAGMSEGEKVAMLTVDDPSDLLAQGDFLGIDLDDALRREHS